MRVHHQLNASLCLFYLYFKHEKKTSRETLRMKVVIDDKIKEDEKDQSHFNDTGGFST